MRPVTSPKVQGLNEMRTAAYSENLNRRGQWNYPAGITHVRQEIATSVLVNVPVPERYGYLEMAIAATMRPVFPCSLRWENSKSLRHEVHRSEFQMLSLASPASSNWRRFASTRSKCRVQCGSPCPGARLFRKSSGYLSCTGSEENTSS